MNTRDNSICVDYSNLEKQAKCSKTTAAFLFLVWCRAIRSYGSRNCSGENWEICWEANATQVKFPFHHVVSGWEQLVHLQPWSQLPTIATEINTISHVAGKLCSSSVTILVARKKKKKKRSPTYFSLYLPKDVQSTSMWPSLSPACHLTDYSCISSKYYQINKQTTKSSQIIQNPLQSAKCNNVIKWYLLHYIKNPST